MTEAEFAGDQVKYGDEVFGGFVSSTLHLAVWNALA